MLVKVSSIALSFLVLFQSMRWDLGDVTQIDEFMEHTSFHVSKYGDNFFVFLSKHYGELQEQHAKQHQEESPDHEELPFNHQSCVHLFSVFILNSAATAMYKEPSVLNTRSGFFYQETYSRFEKPKIFQPPKNA